MTTVRRAHPAGWWSPARSSNASAPPVTPWGAPGRPSSTPCAAKVRRSRPRSWRPRCRTSVATVYRTLGLLEEIGALRHVHLSHGPAIYEQADAEDTRHLVCEVCDRHYAVPSDVFETARQRLADEFGFVLDGSHFAIVGRCASCV